MTIFGKSFFLQLLLESNQNLLNISPILSFWNSRYSTDLFISVPLCSWLLNFRKINVSSYAVENSHKFIFHQIFIKFSNCMLFLLYFSFLKVLDFAKTLHAKNTFFDLFNEIFISLWICCYPYTKERRCCKRSS